MKNSRYIISIAYHSVCSMNQMLPNIHTLHTQRHACAHQSYFIHFTCSFCRFERIHIFISDCSFVRPPLLTRSLFYARAFISLVRLIKTINVKMNGKRAIFTVYVYRYEWCMRVRVRLCACVWLPMNKHTITTLWLCCVLCCAARYAVKCCMV